jgi:hypothetical protein
MVSMRSLLAAALLAWIFCFVAGSSFAQETDPLEPAKRAYLEGRFEDSIQQLQPLVKTLKEPEALRDANFFLGLNYLALGQEADAESHFGSAVRHDPSFVPPASLYSPDIVAAYQDVREGLVGRLRVVSEPPGARVSVAGKELGQAPLESTLITGDHLVRVELDGYASEERAVQVRSGDEARVTLSLRALAEPEPAETPEEPEPSEAATQPSTGGGGMSGKTVGIIAGVGGGAAVVALAAGGGGDSGTTTGPSTPSTPTTASRANIEASIAPNPMIAEASGDPDFPWRVSFEITVRETAGLGGNIDFINTTLRNVATGTETRGLNWGAGDVIDRAGTNHVNGRGSLTVPLALRYRLSGGERRAILFAEIRFTDDRGNSMTEMAQANIQ